MRRRALLPLLLAPAAHGAEIQEVTRLTDRIVLVHFTEGRVIHHQKGQKRSDEKVIVSPLDVALATDPANYRVGGQRPRKIYRKSKGTDFAWFVDKWENGRAVNERPDHVKEHWVYLELPKPLPVGKTPVRVTGFPPAAIVTGRSEAVHTNLLGYLPDGPKIASLHHWMGDGQGLDVRPFVGKPFRVVDVNGRTAFTGKIAFRKPFDNQETGQIVETPRGNFLAADVAEMDFSGFRTPGRYRVVVPGVGDSMPFRIGADVLRPAYVATARGLYHNRSGVALTKPYTEFERPAPHHPRLTPGFAGKLRYSTLPWTEYGSESSSKAVLNPTIKGPLDAYGWIQDAGDWDGYESHLRVAQELLTAFLIEPGNFGDGDLRIPESGNGIPDIVDEAAWLPRYGHRLRQELIAKGYGTGGVGLRVAGDAYGGDEAPDGTGRGSWQDNDRLWVVSGESAVDTYRYAGAAAHLAIALAKVGKPDPEGVDWAREAKESFAWAAAHERESEKNLVVERRRYAAALLFALTGDRAYEKVFDADTKDVKPTDEFYFETVFGPGLYVMIDGPTKRDPAIEARIRGAILNTADKACDTADRRALRYGGNFNMPMLIGQQTTPWMTETAIAMALARRDDPARATRYLRTMRTSADFYLGNNALNQTWITGVGPRFPGQIFHMDAWYNGKGRFHEGLIPYSPWRKVNDVGQGPWDSDWANKTLYPGIDAWPGGERWWNNRCSPLASEFTVHQNLGPAAAFFGLLSGPAKR